MDDKELGVNDVVEVLDFLIVTTQDLAAAKADGTITVREWFEIVKKDTPLAVKAARDATKIASQLKNATPENLDLILAKSLELAGVFGDLIDAGD